MLEKIFHDYNEDEKFVSGIFGDWLNKTTESIKDNAFEIAMNTIGGIGSILLYMSITCIAVGVFCLIFNFNKPLRIGFIGFMISMILIVIGGVA